MIQVHRYFKVIKHQINILRLSSNVGPTEGVKYTDTINVPSTKFPQRLSSPKRIDVERTINETCFKYLYEWQRKHLDDKDVFTLCDCPSYPNGDLHLEHALNTISKDIVLRQKIIYGKKVHYIPGWSCHGLPIELKALDICKSKSDPLLIRQTAKEYALDTMEEQKTEFSSWGLTADWIDPKFSYRTMDSSYIQSQLKLFYELYNRNLVFRDIKPVFWSLSLKTALGETEIEYSSKCCPSLTLRVHMLKYPDQIPSNENVYALIWTTAPWSLPSNQLICFHPDIEYCAAKLSGKDGIYIMAKSMVDQRADIEQILASFPGSELQDCLYYHPINAKDVMPFHSTTHVRSTKGTGLMMLVPAHEFDDFLISSNHGICPKCVVDDQGNYVADSPAFLRHKSALTNGNQLVINHIADNIIDLSETKHIYPIDKHTKQPVIVRISKQWFLNVDQIKNSALKKISEVDMRPTRTGEVKRNSLMNKLKKRPYRCISRQGIWGTPIPVFYAKDTEEPILNRDIIDQICVVLESEGSMDFWWTKSVNDIIPKHIWDKCNINSDDVVKGKDILSIAFDSSTSLMYARHSAKIADLCIEGIDQFTGWLQSSILTNVGLQEHVPFKTLFTHGVLVDRKGRKISKSLHNTITPNDVIAKYGTDTLRWWVTAYSTRHNVIPVSHPMFQQSADAIQKIRSILKFLVGCLKTDQNHSDLNFDTKNMFYLDKFFLHLLFEFENEATSLYESYQYHKLTATIMNFITKQLSGMYLHTIKDRLYCGTKDERADLENVLRSAFYILNKILWPIIPFVVEECWSYHANHPFYHMSIKVPTQWNMPQYKELWSLYHDCKEYIRQSVSDTNTWTLDIFIYAPMEKLIHIEKLHKQLMDPLDSSELCEILQVSSITLMFNENTDSITMSMQPSDKSLCPRCRRFAIDWNQTLCQRCESVLTEK